VSDYIPPQHVRPLAICVFSRNGRILVAEGYDPIKGETFYRPLGGGIEFGEYSAQTLERELREELGAEIEDLRYLGTLENIFTFNGEMGHEIVLVYDGAFVDNSLYSSEGLTGYNAEVDERFDVVWIALDALSESTPPLYPDGLLELLKKHS
jgi:8-oxo-dGTP pyrophosphatase MutT (NUDIX family)